MNNFAGIVIPLSNGMAGMFDNQQYNFNFDEKKKLNQILKL